jgi:hypothetical protein
VTALLAGCQDGTGPSTTLVLTQPPDLTAVVFQSTHESGPTPGGYVSQYAVWIGNSGATSGDAGVVVGAGIPVFVSSSGKLTRTTGEAIAAGDLIQVWRDASVAYGAVEAPPGTPCYIGTQIVILR